MQTKRVRILLPLIAHPALDQGIKKRVMLPLQKLVTVEVSNQNPAQRKTRIPA